MRWIVSAASPDSSITTSFARRPTASIAPAGDAPRERLRVVGRGASAAHEQRAPTIVAPTRRGRQVARDGLDLGQLRHPAQRRLDRLVGLGGERVGPGQRRHRLPVVADLDVDGRAARPAASADSIVSRTTGASRVDLVARHLEQQLVVDLEQQPRPEARRRASRSSSRIIAIFMMSAAVPWIGMLMAIRSPAAAQARVARLELGDPAPPPEQRRRRSPAAGPVSLMWSM